MRYLQEHDPSCYNYLCTIDFSQWSAAFDGGKRYGIMTTNVSESVNGALKEVRQLPITALVAATFKRCVEYFAARRTAYAKERDTGNKFPETVRKLLESRDAAATAHRVLAFNHETFLFSVRTGNHWDHTKGGHDQEVDLKRRMCSCGKFEGLHIPCSHAIAACKYVRVNFETYVHRFYTVDQCCKIYQFEFFPIRDEAYWPRYQGRLLVANRNMLRRGKGRPRSRRFHNEMDWTTGDLRRIQCSICGEFGHNRRTCKNRVN